MVDLWDSACRELRAAQPASRSCLPASLLACCLLPACCPYHARAAPTAGIENLTMAHIHAGNATSSGPVVVGLVPVDPAEVGGWQVAGCGLM